MAKGYWIIHLDILDPEGFGPYQAQLMTALRKYGGRFLIRGGRAEVLEGQSRSRCAVIEFESYDTAAQCYNSPEYTHARTLRKRKSIGDVLVTESYDGPQPE
jgi:uncharacterized protein (DUF1330 family)